MSLKKKAFSGIKWTALSSISNMFIQLLQLSIIAHFLAPSDLGLMAIVYAIIGFSSLFMDMGISASIIHKQDISHDQLSSLYWVNIFSGFLLMGLLFALAPFIAGFYNSPELTNLIQILSFTFIFNSFGNQYKILFQKNLQFDILAKISILTVFNSLTIVTILLLEGFGVYAIAYASIGSSLFNAMIFLIIGIHTIHKPKFILNINEIRPMISFGLYQMGERSITYFNANLEIFIIGKILGMDALGVYNIAKNISMRPARIVNPIITKVTFPIMAKVQNDTERLQNIYLKTINYLSSINFFIYIMMALLAKPIVLILFGDKWEESIPILQILSLYGAIRSTGNPQGTLILAKGKAKLGFYFNLIKFFIMPIAVIVGSQFALIGIANSLLVMTTLFMYINWRIIVNPLSGATFQEYFKQIMIPFIINIVSASTAILATNNISNYCIKYIVLFTIMFVATVVLNIIYNRNFVLNFIEFLKKKKNEK